MSTLCNVTTNGGGGGGAEGGGGCDDNNFPPRFVSEAAKSTFKYLKKVQLDQDEVGDEYRWAPFAFQLIPPEDNHRNVEKSELFKKIRLAGGTIHPGADVEAYVPGVIRILNEDYYIQHEDEDIRVPLDTYSSAFIYRCILNKNRGLPLPHPWKYLIPSETSNFGFYDARKILREEIEWEDVGKLVFPPDQKRITAQQWLDELRRQQAKLLGPPTPDPVDDNPPSQTNGTSTPTTSASIEAPANNLPSTSASCRMVHDSSPNHRTNTQRKRSHEPDKDDTADKPSSRQPTPQKKKDTPQPNSSPASAPVATASSSGGQAPLAATPCSSKALSASQVKILVKAVKLPGSSPTTNSSASSPSSPPPPRRIEFERAVPPKPAQSSSTSSPTPSTSKTEPPSPKKMKTDSKSNSSSNATAAKSGQEGKNLGSKEQSSATTSRPSSPKSHSSSAKGNGSVRNPTSSSASSSSSTSSVNGKESSLPSKTRLGKIVAVAGPPKTRRYGPKPNPPPARDDGWVNCDDKNERSSDESVHFSDNDNGNGSDDSEVDVKPKLKPFWARLYSVEEGQRLLDLVCHHNAYRYVHGLKFWKLVEDSKKFKDRTYQSLKSHFHKIVVQKLTSTSKRDQSIYKIEPENLKKLKRGLENKSKKHHNLCPHFEI